MLSRFRSAGLVWPTIAALGALAVLVGLGTWQMQRKAWKEGLIAAIAQRTRAPPIPLPAAVPSDDRTGLGLEYVRVRVAGRFLHEHERHLYAPGKQGPGWLVFTPLVLDDGRVVLVNRGWVPDALKDPAKRPQGQTDGGQEVLGLLRGPREREMFAPDNDAARNHWYWRDISAMWGCAAGPGKPAYCAAEDKLYRNSIDAEAGPQAAGGWPRGGTTLVDLPNRHLEYALTWYGLALTLIGVYLAFARVRLAAAAEPPSA
jgi:surfeit locus 1 family protein